MVLHPRYLTIVPLFHCNAGATLDDPAAGRHVICCRDITARAIYDAIADEGATHFGGAPIVLNTIINAREADRRPLTTLSRSSPPAPRRPPPRWPRSNRWASTSRRSTA
jgi:fatty-acyl-CoA synthase